MGIVTGVLKAQAWERVGKSSRKDDSDGCGCWHSFNGSFMGSCISSRSKLNVSINTTGKDSGLTPLRNCSEVSNTVEWRSANKERGQSCLVLWAVDGICQVVRIHEVNSDRVVTSAIYGSAVPGHGGAGTL